MTILNPKIEECVNELLEKDTKEIALDLVAYLRSNNMQFERAGGYWKNQCYWHIKYKEEYVCFILINGFGQEEKFAPLTIWSDNSSSHWFEDYPLNEQMKEVAWKHVDICERCGACSGGTCKKIFGKEFSNVCGTTFRFINPDSETVKCLKKLIEIRINDILK